MSRKLFGTDGIRGVANEKLTPELAFQLGQSAGRLVAERGERKVVIGRDTRRSGPMLGAALAAGFCSVGVDADSVGIAPTAAISYLVRTGDYALGAVISASHNPAPDNGIKFFATDGRKLADHDEESIEAHLGQAISDRPTGSQIGRLSQPLGALEAYVEFLRAASPDLSGRRFCVDGSHGAAFSIFPALLKELGADVLTVGCHPDGDNINARCGATHPETIQEFAAANEADLGIAFDGDADRAVFSDTRGRLINGDRTIAIWARHQKDRGKLSPAVVVGTVMSNGGFDHFMSEQGITLERADVGDKYVAQRIADTGAHIGGEQSGHLIFPQHGPTGDGLMTALELLRVLCESGKSSVELFDQYEAWPQLLLNLKVARKEGWESNPTIQEGLTVAATELGGDGRVNVRASGTQPILRLMVEASEATVRDAVAARLEGLLLRELGGEIYSRVDLTHALGD